MLTTSVNYSTGRSNTNSARKGEALGRTADPGDRPVMLEPYAFSSLLMAAVVIHGRESLGFLIGHKDRQFIEGRVTNCVSVHAAYPGPSADRGRTTVGSGNPAARKRVEDTWSKVLVGPPESGCAPAGILAWSLPLRNTGTEPADDHICRLSDISAGLTDSPCRETN